MLETCILLAIVSTPEWKGESVQTYTTSNAVPTISGPSNYTPLLTIKSHNPLVHNPEDTKFRLIILRGRRDAENLNCLNFKFGGKS